MESCRSGVPHLDRAAKRDLLDFLYVLNGATRRSGEGIDGSPKETGKQSMSVPRDSGGHTYPEEGSPRRRVASEKKTGDAGRGDSVNPFDLVGRIALVTGAGRGIGRAIAQRLSSLGAYVVVSDINVEGAQETLAIISKSGGVGEAKRLDVSDPEEVSRVSAEVIAAHAQIDILVNNAGICINASALETTHEVWQRQMRVNLDAVFWCCKAFGAHMVRRGSGAIINVSSMAAVIDVRPEHHVAYNVSKAGVAHLSRMLASEWAESGVRVNAVGPGFVATEMLTEDRSLRQFWKAQIPLERFLEPYEIANAIAFLATDAASAITGNHILADGGVTIR
jgi:NAD(P)-dependent dehydrogenase (short-subunit alcohol dehydrogenase family)